MVLRKTLLQFRAVANEHSGLHILKSTRIEQKKGQREEARQDANRYLVSVSQIAPASFSFRPEALILSSANPLGVDERLVADLLWQRRP